MSQHRHESHHQDADTNEGAVDERESGSAAATAEASEPESEREGADDGPVIIDGSNVAFSTEGEQPLLANILAVRDKVREEGQEPIIVADAALRHQIDRKREYEQLVDDGVVKQAPAGTDADYFILSFARELDARIVSNDRYRDRRKQFPDAEDRLIRYMILGDEVVFERRARRRDHE